MHYRLIEGFSRGSASTPSLSALIASTSPLAVLPAGLFFGFLEAGALAMQREVGVPVVSGARDPGPDDRARSLRAWRRSTVSAGVAHGRRHSGRLRARRPCASQRRCCSQPLGGLISERAGTFAVGVEGMMLAGAFGGAMAVLMTSASMVRLAGRGRQRGRGRLRCCHRDSEVSRRPDGDRSRREHPRPWHNQLPAARPVRRPCTRLFACPRSAPGRYPTCRTCR